MAQVSFDGVTKRFGDTTAVDDLTLHVADGELLVLLGSSGCGKTTALRLVAGLEEVSGGSVSIGDVVVNDVDPKDRDVAMVFQSYALYPHLTVAKNIEFPLRQRNVEKEERRAKVKRAADTLGLGALLDRKPSQLSGGQRQRVALARAIVREPLVFLMDEPLSNLDAALRVQTRAEIVELQSRLSTTTIYVTHDQVEAMTMGHRIAVMSEGRLQQVATPEALYARPANAFVAHFLGSPGMNLLKGMLVESGRAPATPEARPTRTARSAWPSPVPRCRCRRRWPTPSAVPGPTWCSGCVPRRCTSSPDGPLGGDRDPRRAARRRDARHLPQRERRRGSSCGRDRTRPSRRSGEAVRIAIDPDPSAYHLFDVSSGDRLGDGGGRDDGDRRHGRSRGPAGPNGPTKPTRSGGAAGKGAPAHSLRTRRRREAGLGYLLLVPAMAVFTVFSFYPFLRNFKLMLYETPPVPGVPAHFVGLSQIIPTITSTQFTAEPRRRRSSSWSWWCRSASCSGCCSPSPPTASSRGSPSSG